MRLLTAALLTVLLAACGEAPSGSLSAEPPTNAPTAEASTTPPTADRTDDYGDSGEGVPPVNEALMRVRPNPATPGATLKLSFLGESVRGVAFSLYEQRGDAWQLAYDLHSDGGQGGNYEPQWYGAGESPGHDDIGIGGPGPDRVPVPDVAAPGEYLVCTANAGSDFCAPLTISPRSSQATAEPPGAEAFTGTWYGPDGKVVSENGPGFKASASSGPAHCGWQSALILSVIWPPGSDNDPDTGDDWRQYVRDPRGVLPMGDPEDNPQPRGRLDTDAKLPASAEDSGFRTDTVELWFPDRGGEWAYLVTPDATERWPRANPPIGCD